MNMRTAWFFCGIVVFCAYGILALMTPSLTDPPAISITLPAPDLAPPLAALSGVWEATQAGGGASR